MAVALVETTEEAPAEVPGAITAEDLAAAYARLNEALELEKVAPAVTPAPKVVIRRAMPDREILAAMNGLGALLAVRLMLALSVIGAFLLAWQAMDKAGWLGISVLVAYALTTVGPLTYLSTKRT